MKQIIFSLVISFLVSCQESNEFQNQVQSAVALIKRAQEMEIVQPELLTSSLTDEELDIEFMTSPEEEGFINTEENSSYNAESFSSEMTKIILQNLEPEGVLDDFNDLKAEFKNSDIPFTDEKVLMDIAIQSIDARRSYLESFLDKTVDECSESFLEKSKQRLETLKKNKENIESWLSKPKDFSQDFISQKLLKCTESKLTSDNKQIFSDWLKENSSGFSRCKAEKRLSDTEASIRSLEEKNIDKTTYHSYCSEEIYEIPKAQREGRLEDYKKEIFQDFVRVGVNKAQKSQEDNKLLDSCLKEEQDKRSDFFTTNSKIKEAFDNCKNSYVTDRSKIHSAMKNAKTEKFLFSYQEKSGLKDKIDDLTKQAKDVYDATSPPNKDECIDQESINPNKQCVAMYSPVCGCDNKDYSNPCQAALNGVVSWTKGSCRSVNTRVPIPDLPESDTETTSPEGEESLDESEEPEEKTEDVTLPGKLLEIKDKCSEDSIKKKCQETWSRGSGNQYLCQQVKYAKWGCYQICDYLDTWGFCKIFE